MDCILICASAHPLQNPSIDNIHKYPPSHPLVIKYMPSHCSAHILWSSNATTYILPNGLSSFPALNSPSFPALLSIFPRLASFSSIALHLPLAFNFLPFSSIAPHLACIGPHCPSLPLIASHCPSLPLIPSNFPHWPSLALICHHSCQFPSLALIGPSFALIWPALDCIFDCTYCIWHALDCIFDCTYCTWHALDCIFDCTYCIWHALDCIFTCIYCIGHALDCIFTASGPNFPASLPCAPIFLISMTESLFHEGYDQKSGHLYMFNTFSKLKHNPHTITTKTPAAHPNLFRFPINAT